MVNLFTKSVATVSGIVFAAAFFIIFTISERQNLRKHAITARQMKDHFQLEHQDTVSRESAAHSPGRRDGDHARRGQPVGAEVDPGAHQHR